MSRASAAATFGAPSSSSDTSRASALIARTSVVATRLRSSTARERRQNRAGPGNRLRSWAMTEAPSSAEISPRSTGLSREIAATAANASPSARPSPSPMPPFRAPVFSMPRGSSRAASTICVPAVTFGLPRPACWARDEKSEICDVNAARRL